MMTFRTKPCQVCNEVSFLDLDPDKVQRWQQGAHVQNVWPEFDANKRELLMTGTHAVCWDVLFPPDEDDDIGPRVEEGMRRH